MDGLSGEAIAIILAGALTFYGIAELVRGVKFVTHKVEAGVHHVLHPHETHPKP